MILSGSERFAEESESGSNGVSEMYPNKGTKKFYRAYVEVKKRNVAEK